MSVVRPVTPNGARSTALVGRDDECRAVRYVVHGAATGSGGALTLVGVPGIGKTSLLDEAAQYAFAEGVRVLRASGVRSEQGVAHAGLHQLLYPVLGRGDQLVVPEGNRVGSGGGDTASAGQIYRVALAILDLMSDLAVEQPLLLIVDDVQWLDSPSAEVLSFVGRRLSTERVGLLFAVRAGREAMLSGLPQLRITPVSDATSNLILNDRFPDLPPRQRRRIVAAAVGNPLALNELPRTLPVDDITGPVPISSALTSAYATWAGGLSSATQAVMLVLAVDGVVTTGEALGAASRLVGRELTLAAVQPAVDAGIVRVAANQIRFGHPLIGSAVYQLASLEERRSAYLATAAQIGESSGRALWHRAAAAIGSDDTVADELECFAARIAGEGGSSVAVKALQRSAELTTDRARASLRLLRAAEVAYMSGQPQQSEVLLASVDRTGWGIDEHTRAVRVEELAEFFPFDERRLSRVLELVESLRAAGDDDGAVGLIWNLAARCWRNDSPVEQRRRLAAVADGLALQDDHPLLLVVRAVLGIFSKRAVLARLNEAVVADNDLATRCWHGCARLFCGDYPGAVAEIERADTMARHAGERALSVQLGLIGAQARLWSGQVAAAAAMASDVYLNAAEIGPVQRAAAATVIGAVIGAIQGEYARAAEVVATAELDPVHDGDHYGLADWQHGLGVAALAAGQHAAAASHLRRILDVDDVAHHYGVRLRIVGDLSECIAATEGRVVARRATADLLEETKAHGTRVSVISCAHARLVLAASVDLDEAFHVAADCDLTDWPLAAARLNLLYGMRLRGARRPIEARAPLRTARDAFDFLAIPGWAQRARRELAATGEYSGPAESPKWTQLTAQEWQIATLAAEGLTNREIGAQLFLSHRTVGSHLYRVFPKLGVSSRAELRAALARHTGPY